MVNNSLIEKNCSCTLSWRRPLSYRNQSTELFCKSLNWFLHNRDFHHERVNCTGVKHRTSDYRRTRSSGNYKEKYHTSDQKTIDPLLTNNSVTYPVVAIDVIKCRALMDTGSGASDVSTSLMDLILTKKLIRETATQTKLKLSHLFPMHPFSTLWKHQNSLRLRFSNISRG